MSENDKDYSTSKYELLMAVSMLEDGYAAIQKHHSDDAWFVDFIDMTIAVSTQYIDEHDRREYRISSQFHKRDFDGLLKDVQTAFMKEQDNG